MQVPFISKRIADAHRTKAVGHSKQILIALTEFEGEFGIRPGAQAAKEIEALKGTKTVSSNDCFRQLLLTLPYVRTEAIFYAPSKISKQPDNDIGTTENKFLQACAKGEVGFVYVDAPDAKDGAPLVVAPLLDAKSGKFDYKKYGGKAVVLMTDGSVQTIDIDRKTGKIFIKSGGKMVDLLSKDNPTFRSAPSIKYPEPKAEEKEEAEEVKKP